MSLFERFRQALGPEKTDELLSEAEKQTAALDAQGVERKNAGVIPPAGDDAPVSTDEADLAVLKALINDQVQAALEVALPAALEKAAAAWAEETVKALDEQRATIEAAMTAQMETLTAQVTKAAATQDAITDMMPRALQEARQRASKAEATAVDGGAPLPDPPTDAQQPFFDGLKLDTAPNGSKL